MNRARMSCLLLWWLLFCFFSTPTVHAQGTTAAPAIAAATDTSITATTTNTSSTATTDTTVPSTAISFTTIDNSALTNDATTVSTVTKDTSTISETTIDTTTVSETPIGTNNNYVTTVQAPDSKCFNWTLTNPGHRTLRVSWSGSGDGNVNLKFKRCRNGRCSFEADTQAPFSAEKVDFPLPQPVGDNVELEVEIEVNCSSQVIPDSREIWTPPAAPSDVAAENLTSTSMVVTWKPPLGDGLMEQYSLTVNDVWHSNWTSNTATMTGLAAYTLYDVQVAAKNPSFWGPMSEKVQLRTAAGVPGTPDIIRTDSTDTSLYLEWTPLTDSAGPILSYAVWCDVCPERERNTSDSFCNITGLMPYRDHPVKVRAYTEAGPGDWSKVVTIRTRVGVPGTPSIVHTNSTNTSIYLEWDELAPTTGPILTYTVGCDICPERETNTSDTSFNMTGLKPYTAHRVKIRAYTDAGPGDWSAVETIQTRPGVPGTPGIIGTDSTDTSLYLEWNNLTDSAGPVLGYTVWCDVCPEEERNTSDSFCNITGLMPYRDHQVKVRAYTEAGPGDWSEVVTLRTRVGVPYAPKVTNSSSTSTSVYLQWNEPTPSTGPIVLYAVGCDRCAKEEFNTSDTFLNLTELRPYTSYLLKVKAYTDAGAGRWSEELPVRTRTGVPNAPTYLTNGSVTNTSVELKWKEPSPSTGPLLRYTLHWSSSAGNGSVDTPSNQSEHRVLDLLPYVLYTFKVRGVTKAGWGDWSDSIQVLTDVGVPHAPTALAKGEPVTSESVDLTWKEPTPSTGPIDKYVVEWTNSSRRGEQSTPTNETGFRVTALVACVNYTFRVLAETTAGRGKWSNSITVQTAVGVPHPPTSLTNTSVGNTSVSLVWSVPSPSTGPVTGYIVYWESPLGSQEKLTGSSSPGYTVVGLLPYVSYIFKVLAVTSAGRGGWSDHLAVQTLVGVPHAPEALEVGAVTNTTVELRWAEPRPSTGPIKSYIIQWNHSAGAGEVDTHSNRIGHKLLGLVPYVNYTFRVLGRTEAGPGAVSRAVAVRTDVGVPHAPKALGKTDKTNTTVHLTWKAPSPSTGPIRNYSVNWRDSSKDSGCVNTVSNVTRFAVVGLRPYVNYVFWVKAVTQAGSGEPSDFLRVQTDIGVPTVPQNFTLVRKTDVSATFSWRRPEDPNAPRIQYIVQYRNDTFPTDVPLEESTNMMEPDDETFLYTISRLLPYTHYSVRVAAASDVGSEPWTSFIPFRTDVAVPEAAVFQTLVVLGGRKVQVDWTTPGHYPGPANYSLQAWKIPGPCSDRSKEYQAKEVRGSVSRDRWDRPHTDEVAHLSPNGEYWFEIMLFTSATDGRRSVKSRSIRIAPEAAEEPLDVTADCRSSPTQAEVSWSPPRNPNGVLRSYVVEYATGNAAFATEVDVTDTCKKHSLVLTGLRPERNYAISVYARVRDVDEDGQPARLQEVCIMPAGVPFLGNTSRVRAQGSGPHHLTLEWNEDAFSDYMGRLVRYAVLVGKMESLGNSTGGKEVDSGPPWSNFSSGNCHFYQATPPGWNPFSKGLDPLECVSFTEFEGSANRTILRCFVGIQEYCPDNETYCNGPLKPDTQYEIKIRAFTRGGYNETDPVRARTGLPPKDSPVGTIVAIVVLLLLAALLGGGGYVLKKRGYLGPITESIRARLRPARKDSKSGNESALQTMGQYSSPRPIKCKHFADHIRIMMSDSHLKFSQEFELLKNESPHPPCSVAEMGENRPKNRWVNIFPFDHSRVKLLPLCDEPGSDFINANYIPGYSGRREYIASQGPLPNTVDDFWRMIWEQSSSMVVMLTQCVERGKKKCEQYWPDSGEAKLYGDLRVTCVSESMLSAYIIRIFHVQLGSYERRVKQMHFTRWPDFGCPECPEDLINFVRAVRDHLPRGDPGPIVVHCSAGVGRTGTFITVDRLAQQLRVPSTNDTVDIYGTVLELRNHRTNMVQTEDQYIYIHLCVGQLIRDRDAPRLPGCEELVYSNIGAFNTAVQRDTGI